MQKFRIDSDRKKFCRQFLEEVYLCFFMVFIVQEFLEYTMFPIDWNAPFGSISFLNNAYKWFFESPQYILTGLVIAKMIFMEKYDWKYLGASGIILLCVRYAWLENNCINILFFALLVIGAKDISFKRIIKTHLYTLTFLLLVTVGASLVGWIENVTYVLDNGQVRYAFGMTYPTNFAAYIFYIVLYYWYSRGEKLKYVEMGVVGLLGLFVLIFCNARCSFVCFIFTVLAMCCYKLNLKNFALSVVLSFSTIISAAFWVFITLIYDSGNVYLEKINRLLSNRLKQGKKGIDIYGFRLWGRAISMNGNGEGEVASKYFFLDSSYMQFAIIYGLVIFGLILLAFWMIGCHARQSGEWILLWILALISVHSMLEQHMLEISNSSFILALFAEWGTKSQYGGTRWKKQLKGQGLG